MATYLATLLFHFQNKIDFEKGRSFKSADARRNYPADDFLKTREFHCDMRLG